MALTAVFLAASVHAEESLREAAPEPPLPAVSAGPQASLLGALALLPPGIRAPDEPAGRITIGEEVDVSLGSRLVEFIDNPSPRPGAPEWLEVEYTIDPDLDARVRRVLKQGRVPLGHVIVMDPASGEVFSYVSTAPESFPATRAYPTASLMKVVTAAAVLHNNPEAADRDCRYVGSPYNLKSAYLVPPTSGGRTDTFWRSLAISNNQCFARLAVHDVGQQALISEMRRTGLLEAPAPRHPAGRIDPIEDALDLGNLGSGLAGSHITPLAAARLAALLAGGELVRPYWIAQVRDANGNVLTVPGSQEPRPVWSADVTSELRELMVGVTARGTARSAFRDERGRPLLGSIRVSGKTGSLSGTNPRGRYEWFIGVAPAEAPRIAIATVVVNGPKWWSKASNISAFTLREIFCDRGHCDVSHAERLHTRARARRARMLPERTEEDLAQAEELQPDGPSPGREIN